MFSKSFLNTDFKKILINIIIFYIRNCVYICVYIYIYFKKVILHVITYMFYTLVWYDKVYLHWLDLFCIQCLYSACMDLSEYNTQLQIQINNMFLFRIMKSINNNRNTSLSKSSIKHQGQPHYILKYIHF